MIILMIRKIPERGMMTSFTLTRTLESITLLLIVEKGLTTDHTYRPQIIYGSRFKVNLMTLSYHKPIDTKNDHNSHLRSFCMFKNVFDLRFEELRFKVIDLKP